MTMIISERIFNRLKEIGMSQKEFSVKTKIAESTISDWKRKGLNPSSDRIPIICEVLGISADELLGISKADYSLDSNEHILVETYRNIDDESKNRFMKYVEKFYIDSSDDVCKKIIDNDAQINKLSESKLDMVENISELLSSDVELIIKKNLVKKLKKLARLDRIKLDESVHESGLNKHLFKYLDYIGIDKLTFVKDYLCHLQPFMISEIKTQEKFENAICVIDEYYRISLYIKADATKGEEIIVSFHENNKHGIAKRNSFLKRNDWVYVFADSICSYVKNTDTYVINIFVTRGVRTFPITVAAHKYDDDGFLVAYRNINDALINIVNDYLEDIYTSDLDSITLFSSLQQLSFTSYGNDIFSNISLLIDSILVQTNPLSKQIADSALCIYCNSVKLNEADKSELIDTLSERFKVNSIRIMPQILFRIEANLDSI